MVRTTTAGTQSAHRKSSTHCAVSTVTSVSQALDLALIHESAETYAVHARAEGCRMVILRTPFTESSRYS